MIKPITLTVEIDPSLRKELIKMSEYKEVSLTNYVLDAVKLQLNLDKGLQFAENNVAKSSVSPEEAAQILKEFVDASEPQKD